MSRLVFDTSPLSHFARADELPRLDAITSAYERIVVQAVLDELANGEADHPKLADVRAVGWLSVVRVDGLEELRIFAEYTRRLGGGKRNVGEASTLAWAETHGAIAIIDDRAATRYAAERGAQTHGTLWLVAEGVRTGQLGREAASDLVDALRDAEAWFPVSGAEFLRWASENGLV